MPCHVKMANWNTRQYLKNTVLHKQCLLTCNDFRERKECDDMQTYLTVASGIAGLTMTGVVIKMNRTVSMDTR